VAGVGVLWLIKHWRLIGIGAAVLAVSVLFWHDRHVSKKLDETRVELSQAHANYAALQAAQAHERKIATEASNDYERRRKDLSDDRADTPVRSVRLCRSPTGYVPAPTPAAAGAGPGSTSRQQEEAGLDLEVSRDIGPELYALADRADEAAARCNSLIQWVKAR
jgi:hypothetical protein